MVTATTNEQLQDFLSELCHLLNRHHFTLPEFKILVIPPEDGVLVAGYSANGTEFSARYFIPDDVASKYVMSSDEISASDTGSK